MTSKNKRNGREVQPTPATPPVSVSSVKLGNVSGVGLGFSQALWQSKPEVMPDIRRLLAGVSRKRGSTKEEVSIPTFEVVSYAFTLDHSVRDIEAITLGGVLVYRRKPGKRAASRPLACGGRFRLVRSMHDGEPVAATIYLFDIPRQTGEELAWQVVASFTGTHTPTEQPQPNPPPVYTTPTKQNSGLPARDAKGRFISRRKK